MDTFAYSLGGEGKISSAESVLTDTELLITSDIDTKI